MIELYEIIGLIILCIIAIGYWIYTRDTHIVRIKRNDIIDLKSIMDLCNLPIVSFYQGDNVFHFLFDTGSNVSYVNKYSNLKVTPTGVKDTFMGSTGEDQNCEKVDIVLYRNNLKYKHTMNSADLNVAFTELKNEYGVLISGILGNDFLKKYKYCLDFKELVAYTRK